MEESWETDFEFVAMNEEQKKIVDEVRGKIKTLAGELQLLLPTDGKAGRYRALAKTKLEECNWAATKCVTRSTELGE